MKCKHCIYFNRKYGYCMRGWADKSEKCPYYTPIPEVKEEDIKAIGERTL